jgi:hypothetical protein
LALSAQPVDATPSGIKLFSKVVFMIQGKRFGLSAVQKSDVWRRWKAGQTLHEIGRAFGKVTLRKVDEVCGQHVSFRLGSADSA